MQGEKPYRTVELRPLNGGVNDSRAETLLPLSQTPAALNVEYNDESVQTSRGSIPFNRQVAPKGAIRCRPDPALSPLYFEPGKAVPLRGYGYLPYSEETDIGGRFDLEGDPLLGTDTYYNRRGRSFEINGIIEIPPEERLYETESRAIGAPVVGAEAAGFTGYAFDEAQDECFCIIQKGGDRTAPMSWAWAVVNVGRGIGLTGVPASRVSNYALVFMWLDSVGWGVSTQVNARYNLTTAQNPNTGAAAQNPTQAYRAVVVHKYVEPGKSYGYSVGLQMDSGSPGGTATNTAWAADGFFKVFIADAGAVTGYTAVQAGTSVTVSGGGTPHLEVYKGPTDSIHYFLKYGIRYAGRDARFLGLGQRFLPWQIAGFLPFGSDDTPLKNGGFQMAERADNTVATYYGGGAYTLTAQHVGVETSLRMNHRGLSVGNTNGGASPWGQGGTGGPGAYTRWAGLGAATAADINPEALRRYHVVTTADMATASMRGARMPITTYSEDSGAGPYRLEVGAGGMAAWGPTPVLIQAFRWHQRAIDICEVRTWRVPRAYDTGDGILAARRKLSLRMSIKLDDKLEPDIANLQELYHCDEAEGTVLIESVVGGLRNGFCCPFGLGTTEGGTRGRKMVFLSGEGEAPSTVDLGDNPIVQREIGNMLAGRSQGFAIEISCVFPEAFYAIQDNSIILPDSTLPGSRPRFVPEILSWDIRDPLGSGLRSTPKPLLTLTHRGALTSTNTVPFKFPMGFSVEVAHRSDQEDVQPIVPSDLLPAYLDAAVANQTRYGLTAPWVGKEVTIQIGIQSTGTADQYDVHIAMTPKDAFMPASGDPGDAEFAYWTAGGGSYSATYAGYFTASHITIRAKDLARSCITVGRWNCGTLGFAELQPRMLLDEIRVYGSSAPGALPATNGAVVAGRNGKLEGANCLPPRALEDSELLTEVGPGLVSANVTEGSKVVTSPTSARFFIEEARNSIRSVKGTYLYVQGDEHAILSDETVGEKQEEFYLATAVDTALATAGSTMTLATPFADATRNGAGARSLRLLFYSRFEDDIRDVGLTLGPGRAFEPGVTTVSDVIVSEPFWVNRAPVTGSMRLRLYWPGGRIALRDLLPLRVRGLATPRMNPCLGIHPHDDALYYAFQGALYEADDRWRFDGPSDALPTSLAFRGRPLLAGVTTGLQADRVEFAIAQKVIFAASTTDTYVTRYNAWVNLDECGEYQTVLWIGDPATNPAGLAGTAAGEHKVHCIFRFSRGRPELVFGSAAFYTGTTRPEKGLFIATASTPVQARGWVLVSWYVATRAAGTIVLIPYCKIMGKKAAVTVNARDNNASIVQATDWLMAASIVNPGAGSRSLMGISRDSYRAPLSNVPFSAAALGTNIQPQRLTGHLHSLCGKVAHVHIARLPWTPTIFPAIPAEPVDFDPYNIDLAQIQSTRFNALSDAKGVGHRVREEAEDQYGIIYSHPFISLWHELGMSNDMASFADFGTLVFATNGGQPARIQLGKGGLAGVLPPTTPLSFHVERLKLWKPNVRPRDPIAGAVAGAALQINHYDNHGNNYWQQSPDATGQAEIAFTKDATTGAVKVFGFKAYVYFPDTSGKQVLWSKRVGEGSGGIFVECHDGRMVVGWYDQYMKTRVFVETDGCVLEPGLWHYINVRKWWPPNDAVDGNWTNEFFTNGAIRRVTTGAGNATLPFVGEGVTWSAGGGVVGTGMVTKVYGTGATPFEFILLTGGNGGATSLYSFTLSGASKTANAVPTRPMKDKLVVRRFSTAAAAVGSEHPLEAKVGGTVRNCVTFTTDASEEPLGTTATGIASLPGPVFTGAAAGIVNCPGGPTPFHPDHVGMYWQWGSMSVAGQSPGGAAAFVGALYKITAVLSNTQIRVVIAGTTTNPDFSTVVTSTQGAVFSGIALKKSQNFDASKMPDDIGATATYPINAFGSPDALDPLSGVAPFNGEFASCGWTAATATPVTPDTIGTNANVFEVVDTSTAGAATADPIEVGTDDFAGAIFSATAPGELSFDDWATGPQRGTWICFDGREYAAAGTGVTSQPRADLAVTKDTDVTQSVSAANPIWKYLQAASVMAGKRFARVAFYDPEQNEVSDPGPALTIKPAGEDAQNPSGQVRYILTDLPAPRQAGSLELWIYMSVAGGSSATLFRVARVPVGTREVAIMAPDSTIGEGPALSFTNGAPPRCSFLAAAQARMFYGRLEAQLDGIFKSEIGAPVSIDYRTQASRFTDGLGVDLTMMRELDGYLVLGKERALAGAAVDNNGNLVITTISTGVGCQAFQSAQTVGHRLLFLSDRGIEVVRRSGITNLGLPVFISKNVKNFFVEALDRRFIRRVSAAINPRRDQYVMATRVLGETRTNRRVSVEFQAALIDTPADQTEVSGYRFGIYEGPNVTALASVPSPDGGTDRLVGGTEEGLAVWLDRDDSQLVLAGEESAVWGTPIIQSSTHLRTDAVTAVSAGVVDSALDGPRGVPIRYIAQDGVEREVLCLVADNSILHFEEPVDLGPPVDATVTLGAQKHTWEMPWSRLGTNDTKTLKHLELETSLEKDGDVQVSIYGDLDREEWLARELVPLNQARKRVSIENVQREWLKTVVESAPLAVGTKFNLIGLTWAIYDTEHD